MHKLILSFLICILLGLPIAPKAQNIISTPECIDYDSVYNRYLVSCWAAGRIIAVDSNGEQSLFWSAPGSVLSNTISGSTFYVTNGSQPAYVTGIDLATGVEVMNVQISGSVQLDGIAADTSGFLYILENGAGIEKLVRMDLSDNSYATFVSDGLCGRPQDVIHDIENNRLLVVGYHAIAPIQAISLPDGHLTNLVTSPIGYLDGIALDNYGNLYISSYAVGTILRYDRSVTNPPKVIAEGYNGPANIDYDRVNNILAIPEFHENRIELIPMLGGPQIGSADFSDDLYGDSDGYLEGGETIELTVSIANNSRDSITDLTVTLFCEDATFHVVNETAFWGNVAAENTVDNTGSPMIIDIPADYPVLNTKFYFVATWNNVLGSQIDTLIINQTIGKTAILLVDDDEGSDIDYYYRTVLENLDVPYDHWDASSSVPDSTNLNAYDIVVWLTGNFQMSPLNPDEITAMEGFLDSGGKLFLTGQHISGQLNSADPDFLHNYLRANQVTSGLVPILAGQSGGQIFGPADSITIQGGDGANNQIACDHIAAINGGVAELNYYGSANLGAVSYNGDYQLVFFSFGYEAIINGDSRWLERDVVLSKILDFFGYTTAATSMNFAVSPGAAMHLIDHTPEFGWAHLTLGYIQQKYHLQVGTDNDWSTAEMWDYGPMTGTDTSALYAGLELLDGDTYYYRIRCFDGAAWTNWNYGRIRMNSLPTAPSSLSPDGMVEMPDGAPVLYIDVASDGEGDALTYTYEVYDDELLTSLVVGTTGQPEGSGGQSSWIIDPAVEPGAEYYWRAAAFDGYETGPWSATASFSVKPAFIYGDANGDEAINVGDAVHLINYVFKNGPAPYPLDAGDADCNGSLNVGDAVYLINYVFKNGPAPGEGCRMAF